MILIYLFDILWLSRMLEATDYCLFYMSSLVVVKSQFLFNLFLEVFSVTGSH